MDSSSPTFSGMDFTFCSFLLRILFASSKALLVASQLSLSGLHVVLGKTDLVWMAVSLKGTAINFFISFST